MYSKRNLKFVITSINGNFKSSNGADTNSDTMTISNCKAEVEINAGTISAGGQAQIMIAGLSAENMAILSAKGTWSFSDSRIDYRVSVFADESLVFSGLIYACFADMNKSPGATVTMLANGGGELQKSNCPDFSASGSIFVRDILKAICVNAKYKFIDLGVDGAVMNPHYSGNSLAQISRACLDANLMFYIDKNTVSAWKAGNPSEMPEHYPVVTPESGLIGYPVFLPNGLSIKSAFSSLFFLGGSLELKTSLPNASGFYKISGIRHFLSSWDDKGDWYTWMSLVPYADTLGKIRSNGN